VGGYDAAQLLNAGLTAVATLYFGWHYVADDIAGASPLGSRVARRAGAGWLVVGDAAGFLDPFTGEGLHRALVSARLASAAREGQPRRRHVEDE
jgi:flavin-dependent dehydrogenase